MVRFNAIAFGYILYIFLIFTDPSVLILNRAPLKKL